MAVRLKDIAADLGVSTVTVSKVLRGGMDIGERTRARVLKRMAELNYQPNMQARGLASGRWCWRLPRKTRSWNVRRFAPW
jgi:LacI family transcriptional regulator